MSRWMTTIGMGVVLAATPLALSGQSGDHARHGGLELGGWRVKAMGQVFPIVTAGEPFDRDSWLSERETYLTQPAVMANLESPGSRVVLRTTLDFEQLTQPDGEYTFGGWGEGFIDKRHPHTILHELMLSVNVWEAPGGAFSVSAGKGFAPYGTEDPMSRPVVKYPTNHHLSQLLERWTVNGVYLHRSGWSLEGGVFGGAEPEDAYDLSNIESFGDSWSARVTKRLGGAGAAAPWEVSASYAQVTESHGAAEETTDLANAALRYASHTRFGGVYALVEASRSEPEEGEGYWSVLAESQLRLGRHQPYARVELATRPEYHREGAPGTEGFFRYDHDAHADGATRWWITSIGYGYDPATSGIVARPFAELQHNRVSAERGGVDPEALFGKRSFWSVSAGFRLFLGGGPMRMGSYGVLDAMTSPPEPAGGGATEHGGHAGH